MIRISLTHTVFKDREDMVMNFNYHPSPRAEMGQMICPKRNASYVTDEMRKRGMSRLPDTYKNMGLSPRNKSIGERRARALKRHRESTLRKWERCAKSTRDDAVAQYFEMLLSKARTEGGEEEGSGADPNGSREQESVSSSEGSIEKGDFHKENVDLNMVRGSSATSGHPNQLARAPPRTGTPARQTRLKCNLQSDMP